MVLFAALVALDVLLWMQLLGTSHRDLEVYFFPVGQGDSELVMLPGGARVLIDGGPPNGRLLAELATVLPPFDRTIDLVVLSNPETDHFGGLMEVLRRYRVGALVMSGRRDDTSSYAAFEQVVVESKVPVVALGRGDRIRIGESMVTVLSPTPELFAGKAVNDASLVLELESRGARLLFTGDIGPKAERVVAESVPFADILKVAHHGSKFSSTASFLSAVRPKLAVIGVGRNAYGHPTPETLGRLTEGGAHVFRTDRDGTVRLVVDGGVIRVYRRR